DCTRPLYLVNQISILSTFDTIHDYNLRNLLNVYHWSCFVMMAVMILILIRLASYKNTLWKSFWSFIDPLVGEGNNHSIKCFSYTLYLLALIPFLEVIRNEFMTSLIAVKEVKLDTLDDLLDPEVTVYMFKSPQYWKNESKMIDDDVLKTKLNILFTNVGNKTSIEDWLKLTKS